MLQLFERRAWFILAKRNSQRREHTRYGRMHPAGQHQQPKQDEADHERPQAARPQLAERGFWRIALAGDGSTSLSEAVPAGDVALVLGSEGAGIRRLVREHCEASAFIPISKTMESLNVSNAAAIALYELRR